MRQKFVAEAQKYQVFPMDASVGSAHVAPRPNITAGRTEFSLHAPMVGLPQATRRCSSTRRTRSPPTSRCRRAAPTGVIVTSGGRFGGYGFYLLKGKKCRCGCGTWST